MITVHTLTYNPYQENTYLLVNEQNDCIIIDPGMHNHHEEVHFEKYINNNNLKPIILLNTHCHVDHVLGNNFVYEKWGLIPQFHEDEIPVFVAVQNYAPQMGFNYQPSPITEKFLQDKEILEISNFKIEIILAPGHSPGHLCYYVKDQNILIGGDVLFYNSIGRTDLPGGDHSTLLESISKHIYTLPDATTVYPGHGPNTNIGFEKKTNPFVRA